MNDSIETFVEYNDTVNRSRNDISQYNSQYIIHNKLNPRARSFRSYYTNFSTPVCKKNLNPNAKVFKTNTRNVNANASLCSVTSFDYMLFVMIATIIAISCFLVNDIVSNTQVDTVGKSDISELGDLRLHNPNRIIIGQLNINSIRNKFGQLKFIMERNIDVFLVSETKLNPTFPDGQFFINGFSRPYRLDRSDRGGGVILFIREHIPSKIIELEFDPQIEGIAIEINLKKRKWLLLCSYNPHKNMIDAHLLSISRQLDKLYNKYENVILMGDFNAEMTEDAMKYFCDSYNLKSLIKEHTCFKSVHNPSCIDLILTNKPTYFQNNKVFETGLSDYHKLTITVLKTTFQKQKPRIINYRNYKKFVHDDFRNDLEIALTKCNIKTMKCSEFEDIFMVTLNKHAPPKKRYLRANNSPFMNATICKAIMVRSRLSKKYLRTKTNESWIAYKKQRNYCVNLIRNQKKIFYSNLNVKFIRDNKTFWENVKPFFSDKSRNKNSIMLIEDNEIVLESKKCADILNNFFSDAVINLDIDRKLHTNDFETSADSVYNAIMKYKYHPSIQKINQNKAHFGHFKFSPVSQIVINDVISHIDCSKAFQKNSIPPTLLKQNYDICCEFLVTNLNNCIIEGKFPDNLKYADIFPNFKKGDHFLKDNYRPVSILPTISKVYEKILYQQMYQYFNNIFSQYLCGFRKGYSAQHCMLFMLEKIKHALDKGLFAGMLLTDLSKAFDCLSHDLLIAKLYAYGFSKDALKLIDDYLTGRKQRTKIDENVSAWRNIIHGVPQGSILGVLFFNIYINDLFLFCEHFDIANYADDNTPYEFSGSLEDVISKLEQDSLCLIQWFKNNYLKPNPDKWHLLLSQKRDDLSITIAHESIHNSENEKLLGIFFDNKLKFKVHIDKLCKKAGQKLHALARISNFMDLAKRKLIMNAFISSQFSYCPLIWMCHSRGLNSRINRIHERALRIVYRNYDLSFESLLQLSGSVTIHHRNLQLLVTELYKVLHNLAPPFLSEIFQINNSLYNLRNKKNF